MAGQAGLDPEVSSYRRLLRNRAFVLLWGGQSVSYFGDRFFNLAVMWVIYAQSGSTLQTALIGVAWHLSDVLFGLLAGVWADRWDRKRIMVTTNVLAAVVVGAVAAVMFARGSLPLVAALAAVFLLNCLTTFLSPAQTLIMPQVVGRGLLATALGLLSSARQVATLVGDALAGVVIAAVGAVWAVVTDALSFVFVALCVAAARLPGRTGRSSSSVKHPSLIGEIRDGWRVIADQPVVRAGVWLGMLINVASLTGPLYPALVSERLNAGAAAYGAINAAEMVGAMAGGVLAGAIERRLGAGRALAAGWGLMGACTLGIAASTSVPLTVALGAAMGFGLTAGAVSMGAVTAALVPEDYRGRVFGITRSLSVIAIPISTLIGGWLADMVGVAPLFAFSGAWVLAVAALAWSNPHVRTVRI
jgi:DHA3 family macrolide efflux protein-like MFS transporter